MKSDQNINNELNNDIEIFMDENGNPVQSQYVDSEGNPVDPNLVTQNNTVTQYVDEFGNPIDPSLIDEFGNYIGENAYVDEAGNPVSNVQNNTIDENTLANQLNQAVADDIEVLDGTALVTSVQTNPISASEHQMDNKEMHTGMVTFDYNNVPITDIVNSIILDAINKGASDLHFDPFEEGIKIRIRIDGQLNDYSIVPLYVKKNMITRIKIISGMNITESRNPQDGAIRTELQNKTVDLRVSCLPTNVGEKIVIRIMDYSMSASGIEALDFSEENLDKVRKMLALPNGIILVTGATGTGKSTTVYAMLQKLNVEGTNLVTVEDPIEMNIGGINQVQAAAEIGLTFATVLRSILRQDPDVIMIGEIRDDETARIAVRASITGHLVLSTIHTNNSLSTIERLTDMSVERYLLGSALSGIVSQKLSRRLCDKCKKLRPTTDYEKDILKKVLDKDIENIYEPVGCPECSRGYRGRIAIHEVLLLNQNIRDAITKGVAKTTLRSLVYSNNGTSTMLQDGLEKVLQGKTSFDEILKLIDLEDDLGSGTQLGLDEQIEASNIDNPVNTTLSTNQPININITPETLSALQMPALNPNYYSTPDIQELDEEDEIIIKPKRKKKKRTVIEIDPTELKALLEEDNDEDNDTEILEDVEDIETLETPAFTDSEDDIIEIKDNTISEQLNDIKKMKNKKKFNIQLHDVLESIEQSLENELEDDITSNLSEFKSNYDKAINNANMAKIDGILSTIELDNAINDLDIEPELKEEEIDEILNEDEELIDLDEELIPISTEKPSIYDVNIVDDDDEMHMNEIFEDIDKIIVDDELEKEPIPINIQEKPLYDVQIAEDMLRDSILEGINTNDN